MSGAALKMEMGMNALACTSEWEFSLDLCGKNILVVGLGSTGLSVARFLSAMGANVSATDLRLPADLPSFDELTALGVEIEAGGHGSLMGRGSDMIVLSPGVDPSLSLVREALDKGIEVISEIELAARFIREPIIAVAGTNGKTTTTELLGEVLRRGGKSVFVGGNIGTPAIEYLSSGEQADCCVLEVSSFQLEGVRQFRPHISILLNISADHLDRYAGFEEYADTKFRLFSTQQADDVAIVNIEDPVISGRLRATPLTPGVVPFRVSSSVGSSNGEDERGLSLDGSKIVYKRINGAVEEYEMSGIKLIGVDAGGVVATETVMAVIATAREMGISKEVIIDTVRSFKGLSHRLEFVRELKGVTYINDSKATNVGAMIKALDSVNGPVVLLAGGVDKGGDYLVAYDIIKEKVSRLILIGEASKKMQEAFTGAAKIELATSFADGVKRAARAAITGDTVLLSPACSSFDEFGSYAERGDTFKSLVMEL